MNSFTSICKVFPTSGGPIIPPNSPHLLYDPIISYGFDPSYVSNGYCLNFADATFDLQLNNSATVGTFNNKNCLILNNSSLATSLTAPYARLNTNKYLTTSSTYTNITYSYWVYHSSLAQANSTHFSWGDNTNAMLAGFSIQKSGKAKFTMNGSIVNSASRNFNTNTWYYVAIVSSTTGATMYINGTSALTQTGTIVINGNRAAYPLSIGVSLYWSGDQALYGYVANFRLYGKALTNAEINNIYSLGVQ